MTIEFKAQGKRGEVLIYEQIGEGFFGDGLSAKSFAEELKGLGNITELNVRINSPGGNVFDGFAIFNTIRSHKANVIVDIDGLAASAASVIAMAGNDIRIADNAHVMIHEPISLVAGTANELRSAAEALDSIRASILDTYVAQTGEEQREQLDADLAAETWYSASEALEIGLVDSVTDDMAVAACADLERFRYRNVPPALASSPRGSRPRIERNRSRVAAMHLTALGQRQ